MRTSTFYKNLPLIFGTIFMRPSSKSLPLGTFFTVPNLKVRSYLILYFFTKNLKSIFLKQKENPLLLPVPQKFDL
ncbi:hypothetical protein LBHB_08420 [Leptospira borgpetersenii serovar Hardjo]|nr:hypothetical protein LBHB_08420 [Leptospira borgpetersenii serovar Hardjo]